MKKNIKTAIYFVVLLFVVVFITWSLFRFPEVGVKIIHVILVCTALYGIWVAAEYLSED